MKRQTKKSLTRKLDKLVSEIVRSQGQCCKCHNKTYELLQACHCYSRTYRSVRWDLLNVLCLCAGCHFWAHKNPILFTEFVKDYLGEIRYEQLKINARQIHKWTVNEMLEYYEVLKKAHGK